MDDVARDIEVREFLMRRRESLRVEDVQLGDPATARRRVPGLRREEVARLAGVSTDYYTRLEQGRVQPSESVLNAVARALRLTDAETSYLFEVVRPPHATVQGPPTPGTQVVRTGLRELLETWQDRPALIIGHRTDVLATNSMARELLADFPAMPARERNFVRWLLLDARARALYPDWTDIASEMVARLRMDVARRGDDARTAQLVAELEAGSPEFRAWWADHRVLRHSHGRKRLDHPVAGRMELNLETLSPTEDPGLTFFVYSADRGSRSSEALQLLADRVRTREPRPAG
jgi:transcriptional regulator with XRE-family HTH domain